MNASNIENYWYVFLDSLSSSSTYFGKTYATQGFRDTPELADQLGQLVVSGTKTAKCSALWEWEAERRPLPQPGGISIVLDGQGQPMGIIETIEVYVCRFNSVDEEFAQAEGNLSLEDWRKSRISFFSRELPKIGREFTETMPLVCERFKLIYK